MADAQVGNQLRYVDKRQTQGVNTNSFNGTTTTNTKDIAALKARLTAISAVSYSPARLANMTENDMIYAVRLNDDLTSI